MVSQVLQQPVAGPAVLELIEQHAGPDREAELTARDESCRRGGRDDARYAAATTGGHVAAAVDHAPVRLDLNL